MILPTLHTRPPFTSVETNIHLKEVQKRIVDLFRVRKKHLLAIYLSNGEIGIQLRNNETFEMYEMSNGDLIESGNFQYNFNTINLFNMKQFESYSIKVKEFYILY